MSNMKILTIDIETSPLDVYAWRIFKENIGVSQIKKPTRVLSWAARWYGSDETIYASERTHTHRNMILAMYELLDEADVVVGWNSKRFDVRHLNREFFELGLPPPRPFQQVDVQKVYQKYFNFPSYKLEYVARVILGERKIKTDFELWVLCLENVPEAWDLMEEYNCYDTELTEKLYGRVIGWIDNHPNHGLYVEDQENPICRNCGGTHVIKKGKEFTTTGVFAYQRYKCRDCGANLRGRSNIKGGRKNSPQVLK